ncbi:hypothetical protein HHI36_019996, partial [Cryptolaemus montrouzieri]
FIVSALCSLIVVCGAFQDISAMATRSKSYCEIFGNTKLLDHRVSPTYADVMLHNLFIHKQSGKDSSVGEILQIMIPKMEEIFEKASVPTVSLEYVEIIPRKL